VFLFYVLGITTKGTHICKQLSTSQRMSGGHEYSSVQMRSLDAAKAAHKSNDIEASKAAHDTKVSHSENHSKVGGHIKSIVFGGLDGIITTFAVVAGAAGGGLSVDVILILGFSSVFADAVSMGVGDALSTKAENEYILAEKRREEWELENYPEGEIEEMIDLYEKKGLPRKDAETVINIMAKHKEFFVDVMMAEELELQVPAEDDNPWVDGGVTFCSFVFFGTIPLLAYAVFYSVELYDSERFIIACCLTAICLFALGVTKSRFTEQNWLSAGSEILTLGGAVAGLAYFLGWFVGSIVLGGKGETGSIH
jgi:vacuolar iron transporter family protein